MRTGHKGLVRVIGRWSLVALTINSVIGSGVFGLPSTVLKLLGPQSTLAVVLAGAVIGVIMVCFAEVASYFTEAGGPYLYARTAFGRLTGLLVAWLLYLAQCSAPAANANLFVIYLAQFWPPAMEPYNRMLILTGLVGFLAVINLVGVRQGTTASNVLTIAKIVPLVTVILAGAAVTIVHPARWTVLEVAPKSAWLSALVLLIFAYGGFETAMTPMSEARSPRKDAGFALFAALISCTLIYGLIQWVVVGVLGPSANTDRPLADVARATMGDLGASLIGIGALLSLYGYLSAKLLAMPRLTFALAESGELPGIFGSVSRRFHTPWFSIVTYAVLVWLLSAVGSFKWNVTLSAIARLFYYAIVCAALIAMRRKRPGAAQIRLPGGPVLAVAGVFICLVLVTQVDLSQSRILAATVVAALLNWWWVRTRKPIGEGLSSNVTR